MLFPLSHSRSPPAPATGDLLVLISEEEADLGPNASLLSDAPEELLCNNEATTTVASAVASFVAGSYSWAAGDTSPRLPAGAAAADGGDAGSGRSGTSTAAPPSFDLSRMVLQPPKSGESYGNGGGEDAMMAGGPAAAAAAATADDLTPWWERSMGDAAGQPPPSSPQHSSSSSSAASPSPSGAGRRHLLRSAAERQTGIGQFSGRFLVLGWCRDMAGLIRWGRGGGGGGCRPAPTTRMQNDVT